MNWSAIFQGVLLNVTNPVWWLEFSLEIVFVSLPTLWFLLDPLKRVARFESAVESRGSDRFLKSEMEKEKRIFRRRMVAVPLAILAVFILLTTISLIHSFDAETSNVMFGGQMAKAIFDFVWQPILLVWLLLIIPPIRRWMFVVMLESEE